MHDKRSKYVWTPCWLHDYKQVIPAAPPPLTAQICTQDQIIKYARNKVSSVCHLGMWSCINVQGIS